MNQIRLRQEIDKLIYKIEHSSLSLKRLYYCDYEYLSVLSMILGYSLQSKVDVKIDDNYFTKYLFASLDELDLISDNVINMFKDINFYSYYGFKQAKLSNKEKNDIFGEFLSYFSKDMLCIYKKLYDEKRIGLIDLNHSGMSFFAPHIDSYYILLDNNSRNSINDICTLVHELAHVYALTLMKNYSSSAFINIQESFLSETIPLYVEYSLCDWMIKNNIYVDDVLLYLNAYDYSQLYWFKVIKYFIELVTREDVIFTHDNEQYNFTGNTQVDIDKNIPFFRYVDSMKDGEFVNFKYAISSLDAYKLLECEKAGRDIRKALSNYCSKYQYIELLQPENYLDYDLSFMKENILKRTNKLKSKYPIPGYSLEK